MNVALPAGTGDEGWLRAFHATVPELLEDFRPQVLVTQHGADTHFEDPLAHLAVSLDAQRMVQEACHGLAHEYAGGRWLALGVAGTRWWMSCRGPGRIWWGSPGIGRWHRRRWCRGLAGPCVCADPAGRAGADDRWAESAVAGVGGRIRPRGPD